MNIQATDSTGNMALQAKREQKANDAYANAAAATQAKKQRQMDAAKLTQEERAHRTCLGMQRLARKAIREESHYAAKIQAAATEAESLLREFSELAPVKPEPILSDATTKAAKSLLKALPGCFDCFEDASDFANQYLPLRSVREAQVHANDKASNANKRRSLVMRQFWVCVDKVANMAETTSQQICVLGDI